jgi:hypothetical protein
MSRINSPLLRTIIDQIDPNRRTLSRFKEIVRKPAYDQLNLPWISLESFNQSLSEAILSEAPFSCGKIGGTESFVCKSILKTWSKNNTNVPARARRDALLNSGIYPNNYAGLSRFAKTYINALQTVDVINAWYQAGELEVIRSSSSNTLPFLSPLVSLEPYYCKNTEPWTSSLENKKVLVVSPFAESIYKQYENRLNIWPSGLLPSFSLSVLRFPHSPITDTSISPDFHDRVNYFKNKIISSDFDVLIAGCGAAAFPLAAFAKHLNKVGIAMGGSLQILFGIRGRRWDNDPFFKDLVNSHWVRPLQSEVPLHATSVENKAYW